MIAEMDKKTKIESLKTVSEIDELGSVYFLPSKRLRKIRLRIDINGKLIIEFPNRLGLEQARHFIMKNIIWIAIQKKKLLESYNANTLISRSSYKNHEKESRQYLKQRITYLAQCNDFSINRLFIRNQKTRWGSCSSKNNINLNINLTQLPLHLIDYVIFHELVHTRVKNHSADFWAELEKHVQGAKKVDAELKKYRLVD